MPPTDLAADLAILQAAAARADAHHEFIPKIAWPAGIRMAVNVTLDFDAMLLRRLMKTAEASRRLEAPQHVERGPLLEHH